MPIVHQQLIGILKRWDQERKFGFVHITSDEQLAQKFSSGICVCSRELPNTPVTNGDEFSFNIWLDAETQKMECCDVIMTRSSALRGGACDCYICNDREIQLEFQRHQFWNDKNFRRALTFGIFNSNYDSISCLDSIIGNSIEDHRLFSREAGFAEYDLVPDLSVEEIIEYFDTLHDHCLAFNVSVLLLILAGHGLYGPNGPILLGTNAVITPPYLNKAKERVVQRDLDLGISEGWILRKFKGFKIHIVWNCCLKNTDTLQSGRIVSHKTHYTSLRVTDVYCYRNNRGRKKTTAIEILLEEQAKSRHMKLDTLSNILVRSSTSMGRVDGKEDTLQNGHVKHAGSIDREIIYSHGKRKSSSFLNKIRVSDREVLIARQGVFHFVCSRGFAPVVIVARALSLDNNMCSRAVNELVEEGFLWQSHDKSILHSKFARPKTQPPPAPLSKNANRRFRKAVASGSNGQNPNARKRKLNVISIDEPDHKRRKSGIDLVDVESRPESAYLQDQSPAAPKGIIFNLRRSDSRLSSDAVVRQAMRVPGPQHHFTSRSNQQSPPVGPRPRNSTLPQICSPIRSPPSWTYTPLPPSPTLSPPSSGTFSSEGGRYRVKNIRIADKERPDSERKSNLSHTQRSPERQIAVIGTLLDVIEQKVDPSFIDARREKSERVPEGTKSPNFLFVYKKGRGWRAERKIDGRTRCAPVRPREKDAAADANGLSVEYGLSPPNETVPSSRNWKKKSKWLTKRPGWVEYYRAIKIHRGRDTRIRDIHKRIFGDPNFQFLQEKTSTQLTTWRTSMKRHNYDPINDLFDRKVQWFN